jgi:hypothetical protein
VNAACVPGRGAVGNGARPTKNDTRAPCRQRFCASNQNGPLTRPLLAVLLDTDVRTVPAQPPQAATCLARDLRAEKRRSPACGGAVELRLEGVAGESEITGCVRKGQRMPDAGWPRSARYRGKVAAVGSVHSDDGATHADPTQRGASTPERSFPRSDCVEDGRSAPARAWGGGALRDEQLPGADWVVRDDVSHTPAVPLEIAPLILRVTSSCSGRPDAKPRVHRTGSPHSRGSAVWSVSSTCLRTLSSLSRSRPGS